ncbi:MAG: LacI family transcriptional regulator [Lachnospiraceae bacterium]|jgi:LacI family transcriptional regulator|nr:LacI family transcriptional regulator [Lachnospiraceae bacterium]
MVSIRDVAARCHVSTATVSKALNYHRGISEATGKIVRQAAQEMQYCPNTVARTLKTKRTFNIGVLFQDEGSSGLMHEYFMSVLEGFRKRAEAGGYDLTFINTRRNVMVSYAAYCRARQLEGAVIACVDLRKKPASDLLDSEIPTVTIDHEDSRCMAVLSDNVRDMEKLTDYICRMGHRKIAYIHGQSSLQVVQSRLEGFFRTLGRYGITLPDGYLQEGSFLDAELAAQKTRELLNRKDRPTCILFPDDMSLVGGLSEIEKEGLKIPEDISVAGYDGSSISRILQPEITTVRQDSQKIGSIAADRLIEAIEHPAKPHTGSVLVGGELIEGKSVGYAATPIETVPISLNSAV